MSNFRQSCLNKLCELPDNLFKFRQFVWILIYKMSLFEYIKICFVLKKKKFFFKWAWKEQGFIQKIGNVYVSVVPIETEYLSLEKNSSLIQLIKEFVNPEFSLDINSHLTGICGSCKINLYF